MLPARARGVQARTAGGARRPPRCEPAGTRAARAAPRAGRGAPGGPTPHNGTRMSTPGSVSPRPLPVSLALAVTLAGVAAMFSSGLLASRLAPGIDLRGQIAFGTVLLVVPALAALALRPSAWPSVLGPAAFTRRTAAMSILLGAALWVGSIGLMEMQSLAAPPPPHYLEAFRTIHRALAPSGPHDALVSLAVIAFLPGLCEELVVRGVLLPSLVRGVGPQGAVAGSALLFAAMHFDPYRFLFTLALGLVLGALRLSARSLWPPVVAHVALNALTFLIAPLVDDAGQAYTPEPALGLACLAAGAAAAWPLFRALRPAVDSPRGPA
jgi:membrane protease YdiL (CAAX protease family)